VNDDDRKTKRITPSRPRNVTFERSQHPDALAAKPSDYARRLSPAAESGPLTKATVANGKTLHMPHPTEKMCVGYDVEQKANVWCRASPFMVLAWRSNCRCRKFTGLSISGFLSILMTISRRRCRGS
jgi:hypothetical protein